MPCSKVFEEMDLEKELLLGAPDTDLPQSGL